MERQKVIFPQINDNGVIENETMWCIKENGNYIVDNIPFVAKRVSLGDTIQVEYDDSEGAYYFEDFVAVSGNTTLRVYFENKESIEEVRKRLGELGCETEAFLGRTLIAVNVPKDVDYRPVKQYLDEGENAGKWTYEESCLAHDYWTDNES
jgi:hypothetical protein